MKVTLTDSQAELLQMVLRMQLQAEQEHFENCYDSIDKANTRSYIRRIKTLLKKFEAGERG